MALFCCISAAGTLAFFAYCVLAGRDDPFSWLVMQHNYQWQFSDFFRQIVYASDLRNIYFNTSDAPFPPLAYCLFHLLWLMDPVSLPIELASWDDLAYSSWHLLMFLMIVLTVVTSMLVAVQLVLEDKYPKAVVFVFFLCAIFSAPFMAGAIERGNAALLVLVLLLFALHLKDRESRAAKEAALVLIAVAVGFKIYPAIFILCYAGERRWGETVRLALYSLIAFFGPFAFAGGIDGLARYCSVLATFEDSGNARWTSIRCFFTAASGFFGWDADAKLIGFVLENAFLALSAACIFAEGRPWKRILFAAGVMAVYVSNSYRYTSVYMFLPLVFYLGELAERPCNIRDLAYVMLFAATFTVPIWAFWTEVDLAVFLPIYALLTMGFIDTGVSWCKRRKANHA